MQSPQRMLIPARVARTDAPQLGHTSLRELLPLGGTFGVTPLL